MAVATPPATYTKAAPKRERLLCPWRKLRAGDVDGARAFVALLNLEGDSVALAKFIKGNTLQVLRVEEEILRLAFARDESKSTIRLGFDGSGHDVVYIFALEKTDLLFFSLLDPYSMAHTTCNV
jgi:hypothetical protein